MASIGFVIPTRLEILGLYHSLICKACEFGNYSIQEYTKRCTIDGFLENKTLTDPQSISSAYMERKSQLAMAKRQAVVYSFYAPKVNSVMELESAAILNH